MLENKSVLAIIPARGGSKGIPHKNIADVNGRPLISYTISAAKDCPYIDWFLRMMDRLQKSAGNMALTYLSCARII